MRMKERFLKVAVGDDSVDVDMDRIGMRLNDQDWRTLAAVVRSMTEGRRPAFYRFKLDLLADCVFKDAVIRGQELSNQPLPELIAERIDDDEESVWVEIGRSEQASVLKRGGAAKSVRELAYCLAEEFQLIRMYC